MVPSDEASAASPPPPRNPPAPHPRRQMPAGREPRTPRRFHRWVGLLAVLVGVASTGAALVPAVRDENRFGAETKIFWVEIGIGFFGGAVAFGIGAVLLWWLGGTPAQNSESQLATTAMILGLAGWFLAFVLFFSG
ncbi:MAG: hypothetical protein ACR2P0_08990 [Acidimicrobiales bacterium]